MKPKPRFVLKNFIVPCWRICQSVRFSVAVVVHGNDPQDRSHEIGQVSPPRRGTSQPISEDIPAAHRMSSKRFHA
jgi:hypothetical protein